MSNIIKTKMKQVTFNVDDVNPIMPSFTNKFMSTYDDLFKCLLSNQYGINFIGIDNTLEHVYTTQNVNSFLATCMISYENNYPLQLFYDIVKLAIVQGFSQHINQNPEQFRNQLVNHNGKKVIIIEEMNTWNDTLNCFCEYLKSDVKDKCLVDNILKSSESSNMSTKIAINISLMDMLKNYYDYSVIDNTNNSHNIPETMTTNKNMKFCEKIISCGIPSINLIGSINEWNEAKMLVEYLNNYDFGWYTEKMVPIIDEFVNASNGNPTISFWKNMVRSENEDGTYSIGWIKYFFPYKISHNVDKSYLSKFLSYFIEIPKTKIVRSNFNDCGFGFNEILDGMISITITIKNKPQLINFYGGFMAIVETEYNTRVKPGVSWCVISS